MAGWKSSFHGSFPNRWCNSHQPITQPGMLTDRMPVPGIRLRPLDFRYESVNPSGAHPLEFRPLTLPLFASYSMAKRSPPMPFIIGCITPIAALVAIAASAAEPPLARIEAPAWAARVCSAAAIPSWDETMERPCDQVMILSDRSSGTATTAHAARTSRINNPLFMHHLPKFVVAGAS